MIHGLKKNSIFSRKDAESRKKSICHTNFSPYFRCHVQGEVYTVVLFGHGLKGCRVNLYQVCGNLRICISSVFHSYDILRTGHQLQLFTVSILLVYGIWAEFVEQYSYQYFSHKKEKILYTFRFAFFGLAFLFSSWRSPV